jgi:Methyltransferase domain
MTNAECGVRSVESGTLTRLDLLDTLPRNSIGAELGVFEGAFSRAILERVSPEVLFLVDLFTGRVSSGDENGENVHSRFGDELYQLLRQEHAFNAGVHVVKSDSIAWLQQCRKGMLDWVYIDTTHDYTRTREELEAARHAVSTGGMICGHDFSPQFPGVIKAVLEFHAETGGEYQIFRGDKLPSYRIQLP